MSEQDVFRRLSPSQGRGLKKPPMRLSPQRNGSIIKQESYRIPPRRLESPKYLSKLGNVKAISMTYTSPLRPRSPTVVATSGSLNQNSSPNTSRRRSNNIVDDSPIKGKNILTKLKQEINMIDKLGSSTTNTPVNKEEGVDNGSTIKKTVRFDIPSNLLTKHELNELYIVKQLLDKVLQQQKEQNEKLDKILKRQDELELVIGAKKDEKK